MLFCEAVRNGPGFVTALEKAHRLGKPVIAIKVGRTDAGTRATASHTASLSGSYAAYHAVFERYGVIEAEDADEAVAIAGVVLTCPLPRGRRAGIITPSGGGGAWMADTLSMHGLTVPGLSADMQAQLRAMMPSYGAPGNPVDVTAQGSNTRPAMMTALETLARSDEIDMVVLISSLTSETRVSLDSDRIRAVADTCGKPVTVWTYTLPSAFGRDQAAKCGLFLHSDLRNVGVSLGKLAGYADALKRPLPEKFEPVSGALYPGLPRVVPEYLAKQVLAAWPEVKVVDVDADVAGTAVDLGGERQVTVEVSLGSLTTEDVAVELLHGPVAPGDEISQAQVVRLQQQDADGAGKRSGLVRYKGGFRCDTAGRHGYTVRIVPDHPDLVAPVELGCIAWA